MLTNQRTISVKYMEDICDVELVPLRCEKYLKPGTIQYTLNGQTRSKDYLNVHRAVGIILLNVSRNILILVRQFRPSVYIESIPEEDRIGKIDCAKYPAKLGVTVELCSGIVDKELPLADIAAEEVFEECGYKVDSKTMDLICSFPSGGKSGATLYLYYCEVTDDMKVSEGGGIQDEIIDVVEMTVDTMKNYLSQQHVNSTPLFLFAMYWFLTNNVK